ncbi:hypothetical protein MMC22_010360 [Lobaria immixta]|nr:hypothetical protein [Lobaria immixta]
MAEIAGLVFGTSAICSIFKNCFQGYEFLRKVNTLPADAEYLSSRLIIEEHRLLLLGRALNLGKGEATVERDTAAGDHNDESEGDWHQSPTTRRKKYSLPSNCKPNASRNWRKNTASRRAIQRRASTGLWKKNVSFAKKTMWAAVDKGLLTQCVSEFHILSKTLDSAITPSQQQSLSQPLSSQIQRSLSLFEIGKEIPTLGVFERAAAEGDNRYLDLSIKVQRQSYALESESP